MSADNMICTQCKDFIPIDACQQGQLIDGTFYPLHIRCADLWASEEIEVWTVETDDYSYIDFKASVLEEIENLDFESGLTVHKYKMKRIDFLNLPEGNM